MTAPRISIVVPSYNQGDFLEMTLRSVLCQGYPNLELFVLDGGSTDDSVEIIKRYSSCIRYWRSHKDDGQAAAIAEGLSKATGDVCAYLNSDDVLAADSLHAVGHTFATNPHIGWLIGDSCMIDRHSRPYRYLREPYLKPEWLIFIRNCIPQPSVFWRRSLYERTGGINPELHFCMDADLFFQFLREQEPLMLRRLLSFQRTHPDTKTSRLQNIGMAEYTNLLKRCFQLGEPPTRSARLRWRCHRIGVKLLRQSYIHGLVVGLPRARRNLEALAAARLHGTDGTDALIELQRDLCDPAAAGAAR